MRSLILLLLAGCVVPSLDATGKTCSALSPCPPPFICLAGTCQQAGGPGGGAGGGAAAGGAGGAAGGGVAGGSGGSAGGGTAGAGGGATGGGTPDAGCRCVGPGGTNGCTAIDTQNCAAYSCSCVNGTCSGGFCASGTGCTREQELACGGFGCSCVDGHCSGGECGGSGCSYGKERDCAAYGCGCVNHGCSGGACVTMGDGCTRFQTATCATFGCGCALGQCTCAGGFDAGGCAVLAVNGLPMGAWDPAGQVLAGAERFATGDMLALVVDGGIALPFTQTWGPSTRRRTSPFVAFFGRACAAAPYGPCQTVFLSRAGTGGITNGSRSTPGCLTGYVQNARFEEWDLASDAPVDGGECFFVPLKFIGATW